MSYLPTSKFGKCTQCGTDNTACVKIAKDLICLFCNKQNKAKQQVEKAKDKAKVQRAMSGLKNLPDNKEAVRNVSSLDAWFKKAAEVIAANPHCWNCGEFIPEKYYRHASGHIFPKAHFFSVSINPNNLLVLGAGCGCHYSFDSSIEKACKMQIWPIAVERFKTFEKEIREKHKYLDLFKSKIGSR